MKFLAGVEKRGGSASPSSFRLSTPAPKRFQFPRSARLTKGSDLVRVRRTGRRYATKNLEVRITVVVDSQLRLGFIVPLHGRSAVERNRLKRWLREIGRTEVLPIVSPAEIVVRALPAAYKADFTELRAEIRKVAAGLADDGLQQ